MNTYTWGTLADDYVFLEDIGRKAIDWGRDIVNTGRGRGGKRGGRAGRGVLSPKCESLRVQLAARDIGISFVAEGMEKRRLSQSLWDVRTKTVYLTVEFVFHLKISQQKHKKPTSPTSLLTHRNDLATPLAASLVSHIKRKSDVPPDALGLVNSSNDLPEDGPALPPILFFAVSQVERPKPGIAPYQAPALPIRMRPQQTSTSTPAYALDPSLKPQKVFYPINPSDSLRTCLRHRSFVEWPTIEVFPSRQVFVEGKFGILGDGSSTFANPLPEPGFNKRRKTETGLVQLIGGYGEESGSDAEGSPLQENGVLGITALGNYASDEDEETENIEEQT
ncbi:hypothetical protein RhiLY_01241 [Ceratobasidium sp. AG-Ba]|nr:hypothetical protein RhiLY_01241 [Ceratobasidium sp. AG-Ba]